LILTARNSKKEIKGERQRERETHLCPGEEFQGERSRVYDRGIRGVLGERLMIYE